MKELRLKLIGKTISNYDGWSGLSDQFKIGHVQKAGTGFWVHIAKGKGYGVYIPPKIIPQLIETGYAEHHNEIEGCIYKINDYPQSYHKKIISFLKNIPFFSFYDENNSVFIWQYQSK